MKLLSLLMMGALLAACGDDSGSSAAAGGDAGTGGASGTGGITGTGGDAATGGGDAATTVASSTSSGGEGGQGGDGPVEVSPWLFELDGVEQPAPETILTDRVSAGGATDCFERVQLTATLPDDRAIGDRRVEVFACLDTLTLGEPMPLASASGNTYYLQYTHDFAGGVAFPSAEGTLTILEDVDATSRFVAIVEGTVAIAISADEDRVVPLRLEFDQAVEL